MNNKHGFTLVELLIGLLISLLLLTAMATFLGNVGYTFQEHKGVMKDRAMLQQAMTSLTRDLMFIGQSADESGLFELDGEDAYFLDAENDGDAELGTSLTYYRVHEDMDFAASAQGGRTYNWLPITYAVEKNVTDPVTKEPTNILRRNGEPFLVGIATFSLAFGTDSNEDGSIADDEWVTDFPTDDTEKAEVIGNLRALRVTLAQRTQTADQQSHTHTLVRDIYLRNRRES